MLTPLTSRVWHWVRAPWDADQLERGMKPGEVYGFTPAELVALFEAAGFVLESQTRFMLGFNRLYVFRLGEAASYAAAFDEHKKAS